MNNSLRKINSRSDYTDSKSSSQKSGYTYINLITILFILSLSTYIDITSENIDLVLSITTIGFHLFFVFILDGFKFSYNVYYNWNQKMTIAIVILFFIVKMNQGIN